LPDPAANEFNPTRALLAVLAEKIRPHADEVDITGVMSAVGQLLDRSVATEGYIIRDRPDDASHLIDLSKIDFEALKQHFARSRKRIEIEKLRASIQRKLTTLVTLNRSRMDFWEEFQRMIDEYNAGSHNVEEFFNQLVAFAQRLTAEEQRHLSEQLGEEELALFDLLTQPEPTLSKPEQRAVKAIAKDLLDKLKQGKLVLDWRKRQQSQAAVRLCIEQTLDHLPPRYTPELYRQKCERVYQHVYDSYWGQERSSYNRLWPH
jgi:type I restriction enzyme R subunit